MVKKLRKEGYQVGRYLVRKIMHGLRLKATQRRDYKMMTQRKHADAVANNLLNINFNPKFANQIWAGDMAYLKTGEGWVTDANCIPASNSVGCYRAMISESVWGMQVRVGIMPSLSVSLVA